MLFAARGGSAESPFMLVELERLRTAHRMFLDAQILHFSLIVLSFLLLCDSCVILHETVMYRVAPIYEDERQPGLSGDSLVKWFCSILLHASSAFLDCQEIFGVTTVCDFCLVGIGARVKVET